MGARFVEHTQVMGPFATRAAVLGGLLAALLVPGGGAWAQPVEGSFTAVGAPFPYPFWDDRGHRCNAGVEPLHKTGVTVTAPEDGLLTATMAGIDGDWDVFITDGEGRELLASNREQQPGATGGTEGATALLEAGGQARIVACNQLGAPTAEVAYRFEPFDVSSIAATVGASDDGALSFFSPVSVTIGVGQSVRWERAGGTQPHTVTQDEGLFRAGTLIEGSYAYRFTEPGTYYYFCEFHGVPGGTGGDRIGQYGVVTVVS